MVGSVRSAGTGSRALRCSRWVIRGATALCLSPGLVANPATFVVIALSASLTQATTSHAGDNSAFRQAQKQLAEQQRAQRQAEADLKRQMQAAAKAAAELAKRQAKEAQAAAKLLKQQQDAAAKAAADLAKRQAKEAEAAAKLARREQEAAARAAAEQQRREQQAAAQKARLEQQAAVQKARLEQQAAVQKARLEQQAAAQKARLEQQAAAEQRRKQPTAWVAQTPQKPESRVAPQPDAATKVQTRQADAYRPPQRGDDRQPGATQPTRQDASPASRGPATEKGSGPGGGRWTPWEATKSPAPDVKDRTDQGPRGWGPRQYARDSSEKPAYEATAIPVIEVTTQSTPVEETAAVDQARLDQPLVTAPVLPTTVVQTDGGKRAGDSTRFSFAGERSSLGGSGLVGSDRVSPGPSRSWTASVRDADGAAVKVVETSATPDTRSAVATDTGATGTSTTVPAVTTAADGQDAADDDGGDTVKSPAVADAADTSGAGSKTGRGGRKKPSKSKSARNTTKDGAAETTDSKTGTSSGTTASGASNGDASSGGGTGATPATTTDVATTRPRAVEVVGIDLSPATIAAAKKQGFVEVSEQTLAGSSKTMRRFRAPAGMDTADLNKVLTQQTDLVGFAPNHTYRIYAQSGAHDASSPPPVSGKGKCSGSQCFGPTMIQWTKALNGCARKARIGIIDTPYDSSHPALAGRPIGDGEFLGSTEPSKHDWHGTAILALLAGDPASRTPGLIPNADFFFAKAFRTDEHGNASSDTATLVNSLYWLEAMRVQYVNMSFSGPKDSLVAAIIARMSRKGVVFIAAAGNQGPTAPPSYPAAYPQVIAVTAVTRQLESYRYANRGPYVDVAAPGVQIWTALPNAGQGYQTGTSFAAPFVTAVLAARKDLRSARLVKDTLLERVTLKDLGPPGPDPIFGRGLLVAAPTCTGEPEVVDRLRMLPPHMAVGTMGAALSKTSW